MHKIKLFLLVAIVIAGSGLAFWRVQNSSKKTDDKPQSTIDKLTNKKTSNPTRIRLIATGDFIAHDSVNSAAKQADGSYDYLSLMSDFQPIMASADIRFCNDPILNGGYKLGITGYPKFNSPTEFVTDMGRLGCNVVNTASNHSFDFSQANITASVEAWENVGSTLAVVGQNRNQAEHDQVKYFTILGVKFAFLAYTTYSNATPANNFGVNIFSRDFATKQITEAKNNGAQIIIASMRWGTEYSSKVNPQQTQNAQLLADLGVNLILGHGPHVLQPVQQLTGKSGNKTTAWYSLGNFLNSQVPPETLFNGLAIIDFDIKSQQISNMQYLPIYMHYKWTSAQASAENTNARHGLKLYLLESATPELLAEQQLKTTIDAQKARLINQLSSNGLTIPLITSKQLQDQ